MPEAPERTSPPPDLHAAAGHGHPRIAVVADDLIWSSRLSAAVERAGGRAVRLVREDTVRASLGPAATGDRPVAAVVDLGGHAYDGVRAVEMMRAGGLPVVAVSQHEDLPLRKRALAAGAGRVYSYNKMFTDGPAVIAALLEQLA